MHRFTSSSPGGPVGEAVDINGIRQQSLIFPESKEENQEFHQVFRTPYPKFLMHTRRMIRKTGKNSHTMVEKTQIIKQMIICPI